MAAVPASPPEAGCAHCHAPLNGPLGPHVCPACGKPQPVRPNEDYFSALGAERKFGQDRARLERRFYELSRALHPDRFSGTGAGAEIQRLSLERMSFLNQAYSTLKSPEEIRAYLLEQADVKAAKANGKGGQIPLELTEAWFELQDTLAEDPAGAGPKLTEFRGELQALGDRQEKDLEALEAAYDRAGSRELLERIAGLVQARSYVKSLERDLRNKIKV